MSRIERHIVRERVPRLPGQMGFEGVEFIERNPERSKLVGSFPNLNNHPKIRYNDENGKPYILYYPPVTGQPAGKKIAQREWREFDDVESALRAETKIRDLYDKDEGDVVARTKKVIRMVSSLSKQFMGHVSKEDLVEMEKLAAEVFVEEKFPNAVSEEKLEIFRQVLKATRKDIREQINPPRSEMILGHVRVELVRERIIEQITNQAHKGVVETLKRERAVERFMLAQAADYAEYVSRLRPGIGTPLRNALPGIQDFFRRNMSHEIIRLKPYSDVAVESRFLVAGRADNLIDQAILKGYLGEQEAGRLVSFGMPQLRHLTVPNLHNRLLGIASKIRSVLSQGDINLLPEEQRPTPEGLFG